MMNKRDASAGKVVDLEACQVETRQGIEELWRGKDTRGK